MRRVQFRAKEEERGDASGGTGEVASLLDPEQAAKDVALAVGEPLPGLGFPIRRAHPPGAGDAGPGGVVVEDQAAELEA